VRLLVETAYARDPVPGPNTTPDPYAASLRRLFLRSLIAFTTAFLIATMAHEGAHAVMARALGLHPVLHHNYVATPDDAPKVARLWVPAAGPLASLVLGIACLAWLRTQSKRSSATLTVLWLGIHGMIAFFGYLMLGPMVRAGDTGKVYAELGLPVALQWLIAAVGLAVLVLIVRGTAPEFARHVFEAADGVERPRGGVANMLIALPIVVGAVVTSLLSLPAPTFVSMLYPMTSGFVTFSAYGRFRRTRDPLPEGVGYPLGVPAVPLAVLAGLIAVSLGLIGGLRL